MGLVRHEASILLLQGKGLLSFLDGLSTNHVDGPCTTVFTTRRRKSLMFVILSLSVSMSQLWGMQ